MPGLPYSLTRFDRIHDLARALHDQERAAQLQTHPRTGHVTVMAAKNAPAPLQTAGGTSHKE